MKYLTVLIFAISTQASASNLAAAMSGTPELQQETSRALDEVEECIVLSDTPALPQVYRNKMRPDRSLIYYFGGFAAPTVISLVALDDKVSVKLWKGGGAYAAKIKSCL